MPSNVEVFGFENENIRGNVWEKYKAKKGVVDRLGIIFSDPKVLFAGNKVHFKDRFFLCKGGYCCDILGPSKYRIGSVIIKYTTDKLGNIKQPFDYTLFPWMFSEQTYTKLKTLNVDFSVATHDIKIGCTNEDYQHIDITPCQESIWQAKAELRAKILEEAKPIWDYIKRGIASDLSVEEIKDLLGGTPTAGGADPSTKLDLDSVLSQV